MANKRIAFINGKGGVGKSTICALIAMALKHGGRRKVAIQDYDPQGTVTEMLTHSGNEDLIVSINSAGGNCDILLQDTPPALQSAAFATAVRNTDILVLVSTPSPADLFTTQDTVAKLEELHIPVSRTTLLWNKVKKNTRLAGTLDESARNLGIAQFGVRIIDRETYKAGLLLGWQALGSKARDEILSLALEIATLAEPASEKPGRRKKK